MIEAKIKHRLPGTNMTRRFTLFHGPSFQSSLYIGSFNAVCSLGTHLVAGTKYVHISIDCFDSMLRST